MKHINAKRLAVFTLLVSLIFVGSALAENLRDQTVFTPTVYTSSGCDIVVSAGQSIQAAVNNAPGGSVICVRGGTYREQIQLRPIHSGLTVQAYAGEKPILDGMSSIPSGKYEGLIHINASNVTVDGFEVRNSAGRGIVVAQLASDPQVQRGVTVRNNVVRGSTDSGININGTNTQHPFNILIENNVIYDNLLKNTGGADNGGSALVFLETKDSIARGNTVYNNLGEGLVADRWTSNLTFEDNVIYDNKHSNVYLSTTQNPLVQRNLVFCTDNRDYWRGTKAKKPSPGITVRDEDYLNQPTPPPPSNGQVIINNIVVGCGRNFVISTQQAGGGLNNALVANNSFINARGDEGGGAMNVLFEGDANFKNSRFVNNLIVQTDASGQLVRILLSLGDPDMSSFTVANNFYSFAPTKNWINNEPGRVVGNAKLVNPVTPAKNGGVPDPAGYGLQSGSPAVNAGTAVGAVTEDFFRQPRSGALDIGADEQGGGGGGGPTTGRIIVTQSTTPDNSTQVFSFTAGYAPGGFQLRNNESYDSGQIATGTHSVAMTPVSGWATTASCSDGSQPTAISLSAGETVTCTFSSEQQSQPATRIIVRKQTLPAGDAQSFQFISDFAGSFQLTHGGQKSTDLTPGVYAVSETLPAGWTQASASCSDGSAPGAIDLSQGETVTCTFINQKQGGGGGSLAATVYLTTNTPGAVGGVTFDKGDILAYDGRNETWSLHFDASDVGITNSLNDFVLMPDGSILLAISGRTTLDSASGSFKSQLWDVARFIPSSLGNNTAGQFEMYIDGSDIGLSKASEKIDALALGANGVLLISTYGAANVPNGSAVVKSQDEDLLAFQPSKLGDDTQGTWSLAFDGSTIAGMGGEDVTAAWRDAGTGTDYLTLNSSFTVGGMAGATGTVLAITPSGAVSVFWNANDAGFTWPVDGLHIAP